MATVLTFTVQHEASAAPQGYAGHQVVRIKITETADVERLATLEAASPDFDVEWHSLRTGTAEVRVSPAQRQVLDASGLAYVVEIDDLQAALDDARRQVAGGGFFDDYQDYDAHVAFLNGLAAAYPDLAEVFSLGDSLEGRPLWAIHITGPGAGPKPAVFYHGCEHAREWITPPAIAYVAEQLLTNYDSDPQVATLVDNVDWYLLPIMNPDGYVHTWTTERFWRKNRRDNLDGTFGVDLNRNWPVGWGGPGSSASTGTNIYRGTAAFSEPETQLLRDFFLAHPNIKTHLDVHAYGNYCLWSYGHTDDYAADHDTYGLLGSAVSDLVLGVHGNAYTLGPIYTALYPASGVSIDWVYDDRGVWSMTLELRGGGFAPPASEIILACEENLPAMLYLAEWSWDCNGNGVEDSIDIADGTSADCNGNGTPDSCEADCDADGVPNVCDAVGDPDGDGLSDCADACPFTAPPVVCVCPPTVCCCPAGTEPIDPCPGNCFEMLSSEACLNAGGTPDCIVSPLCRDGCYVGDADDDGDLDLRDYFGLQGCYSGPSTGLGFVMPSSACRTIFDFDEDNDVDAADFSAWSQAAFPPPP